MIAAGVNAKALATYMGHSSITITLDRHGHLMPGNESESAERLDSYLANAIVTQAAVAGTTPMTSYYPADWPPKVQRAHRVIGAGLPRA